MSNLQQVREGLTKAWDTITVGWRELRELAGDALTRFNPRTTRTDNPTPEERMAGRTARWSVLAAEVTDTERTIEVALEAPGLEAGDFEIEVRDDVLVIRGEKRMSHEEARGHYFVMERAYGQFERAIKLPAPVDDQAATARYRHGVLHVSLPKTAASPRRRITVELH
jgi:HSP20 family protein